MSFSIYAARRMMNSFLGGASPNAPNFGVLTNAAGFLAACDDTDTPSEDGSGFNEPSGNGYTRITLNLPTDFVTATNNDPTVAANSSAVTFPTASGSWGTITHIGVYDLLVGGNLLFLLPLDENRTIDTGEALSFPAGNLTLTLD